jgi:glycosyltransferase involved in cell wall biosynthesis
MTASAWERAVVEADLVLVGPVPPLRGGIAQHTLRLGEAAHAAGLRVAAVSFARLYPAVFFPGRNQRTAAPPAEWSREILDVLSPPTWLAVARLLETSRAKVVLQWWHPVVAPAWAAATRRLPRERLAAVCHNTVPHEPVPGAAAAARFVLSRCSRVVCHSAAEARRAGALLGSGARVAEAALPCLLSEADLAGGRPPPELAGLPADTRFVVAAGHVRPYKDVALLLRAWRRARRPAGARLVVAGESYLAAAGQAGMLAAAEQDASISIVNRYLEDTELMFLLRSAELVVAAHRAASQSGVVAVARALGTPCLVSDAGGLAEQVAADGAAAEVVPAGDEDALREALERRLAGTPPERVVTADARRVRDARWPLVLDAVLDRAAGAAVSPIEAFAPAARPIARLGSARSD